MKFRQLLLLFAGFSAASLSAQNFYGLQNSNFAGVHAMYLNPAGIADTRYTGHANLMTFGTQFINDYVTLELPFSLMDVVKNDVPAQYKDANGQIKWDPSYLKENLDGSTKNINIGLEFRGPSGMVNIGNRFAFAAGTRVRSALQFNNVSQDLLQFAKSQLDSQPRSYTTITDNRFALNVNAFQEISATGAMLLMNKKFFYLKAGVTAKYLMGLGSLYAINNGIDFKTLGGDTVLINKSDLQVGYTNTEFLQRLQNGSFAGSLPSFRNVNGSGFGFDLGAIFEYRPEVADAITSKNNYLFKAGVSIMDIGQISYGTNMKTFSASNTVPVTFTEDSALSAAFGQGVDSGLSWMKNYASANFNYTEGTGRSKAGIPTTMNIQLDWNIFKWFYLGVNWTQSVVTRRDIALRKPSSFVLLPRVETRLFEVCVPVSVYNDYQDFGLGLFTRIGPVFFGSDNLVKSVNRSSFNGFDFYFGISYGIGSKKSK